MDSYQVLRGMLPLDLPIRSMNLTPLIFFIHAPEFYLLFYVCVYKSEACLGSYCKIMQTTWGMRINLEVACVLSRWICVWTCIGLFRWFVVCIGISTWWALQFRQQHIIKWKQLHGLIDFRACWDSSHF